jgi:predicted nucleic acid-binding protein
MQDYELYLTHFPNLTLLLVDAAVAREAARLRGLHAFKMPDALQLATANVAGADAILTNDKDWHGKTGSTPLLLLEAWV